jgi:crotonobetainyl-CoA:carnitine CoA-transferase CaiB-like acyl-CoA transferase
VEPLTGIVVVDLTRYFPGPFASRELLRLGARVVRLEAPDGDPLRDVSPEWDAALNAGKESVVWDRRRDPGLGPALCARADVVLEAFRPGVAERLGVGPTAVPESVVYCSITGFGPDDRRAGHDLNYMGWAGALAPTAPAMPPLPVADLAAGGLTAVTRVLAALLERARTGRGARIVVSMTEGAHELARFAGPLTGQLACYRIYACADGRFITVAALEPKFWRRLCELVDQPDLVPRQNDAHTELEALFRTRSLHDWLELFDGEDVAVGPVATWEEAEVMAVYTAITGPTAGPPALGQHTAAWLAELGLESPD